MQPLPHVIIIDKMEFIIRLDDVRTLASRWTCIAVMLLIGTRISFLLLFDVFDNLQCNFNYGY